MVRASHSLFFVFFSSLMIRNISKNTPRGKAVTWRTIKAVRAFTPRAANTSPWGDDVELSTIFFCSTWLRIRLTWCQLPLTLLTRTTGLTSTLSLYSTAATNKSPWSSSAVVVNFLYLQNSCLCYLLAFVYCFSSGTSIQYVEWPETCLYVCGGGWTLWCWSLKT